MTNYLKTLSKLREIEFKYKAFIVDIWGVLWDGIEPYENSIPTLKKLISLNKPVILLSNAPRRAKVVSKKLQSIGINSNCYSKIISSGELCRIRFLKNKNKINRYGKKYYFIGQPSDQTITEMLPIEETKNLKEANFLLVCGTRRFEDNLEIYKKELNAALALKLPLVCANPDKVVVRKTGKVLICAGLMADYYLSQGGYVYKFGKPYKDAYQLCFDHLLLKNLDLKKKDVLCIGDALDTDIVGANNYGLDTLLIANGIHKADLIYKRKLLSESKLKDFFNSKNCSVNYILRDFSY